MSKLEPSISVGVLGAGTMGSGIAQIAATQGHQVQIYEVSAPAIERSQAKMDKILNRLVEKGRLTPTARAAIGSRLNYTSRLEDLKDCGLIIEAIIENLDIKKKVFADLEAIVSDDTVLASNTSSLSIAAISGGLKKPSRFLGLHFFNPAPLMPLVEVIPGVATDAELAVQVRGWMDAWGKVTVVAKDTPGFIVNRVARPFYGEAIRILEEGIADAPTIDWVMRELGGFRMGPFQLMDFIGNDINFTVTQTVYAAFFYDPRYRPSFTQQRLVEAGFLGRKSGRGYYPYSENAAEQKPNQDPALGQMILERIVAMLINEAVDAVFWKVAKPMDVDLAMTKGVNYPKGLLQWGSEMGLEKVLRIIQGLHEEYAEDRYRPSPLLRSMVAKGLDFQAYLENND